MFRSGFVLASNGFWLALILAWVSAGGPSSMADPGQADVDRLKQRVNEYFDALHSRQFAEAREFILPQSRGATRATQAGKSRVTHFSIHKIELEEGNRSAIVTVEREVMAAALTGRVKVKERFRWKMDGGEWFFDPADPPKTDAEIFREYYYDKLAARANPKPGETPPPPEVEFEETVFDFGLVVQGDPIQPSFSFRNLASQDIVVERIHGPEWLVKDRTEKRLIPAGTAGEITVELNTAKLHRDFAQDIFVQFEPIKEMVKLRVQGKFLTAEEAAKSESFAKSAASRKSRTPTTP